MYFPMFWRALGRLIAHNPLSNAPLNTLYPLSPQNSPSAIKPPLSAPLVSNELLSQIAPKAR